MDRYSDKGVVESGTAALMMAAYIDLNPVRAGMMADPANYRWCGYGEAVCGGSKGNAAGLAGTLWSARDLRTEIG